MNLPENNSLVKICFITAIYGNYEASCKKFAKQSIQTDFICFTYVCQKLNMVPYTLPDNEIKVSNPHSSKDIYTYIYIMYNNVVEHKKLKFKLYN
jgi:hypothetical protein